MILDIPDVKVENALLRGALFLAVRAMKDYQDAPRYDHEFNGTTRKVAVIPEALHEKMAEAIERAERLLKEPEKGFAR